MDLVSRLKEYIAKTSIPVTQFADICGIARPTLSQLLNRRNKKVSDEIVAKIHAAFPSLSVYWLMFGEGNMEVSENIELSEGNNAAKNYDRDSLMFSSQIDNKAFGISDVSHDSDQSGIIEFFDQVKVNEPEAVHHNNVINEGDFATKSNGNDNTADVASNLRGKAVSIAVNQNKGKLITNIVVFYSDNSFQSFYPA